MTDREKVLTGLEHCDFGVSDTCYEKECPYYQSHNCTDELKDDILALLKEQEAVEPKEIVNEHFPIGDYRRTIGWLCGKCGKALMGDGDYCSYCGKAVKWDD